MAYYVTHIINDELPSNGLRKVYYYTIDTENPNPNEYFLGRDNNPLDSNYIEGLVFKRKITQLPSPILLGEYDTLYSDKDGNHYRANYLDSDKDKVKVYTLNNKSSSPIPKKILNSFSESVKKEPNFDTISS
jgi:hypothetical protein